MLQDFMTTLFSGLLLVVLVFELSKPFKSLKESGWNLKKEKAILDAFKHFVML